MPASREDMIRETERVMPENSIPWIAGFTSEDGAIRTACAYYVIFSLIAALQVASWHYSNDLEL